MALADFVTPETIKIGLAGIDKETAIRVLVDAVVASGKAMEGEAEDTKTGDGTAPDSKAGAGKAILAAVLDREARGSTGLGSGIAIPHARTTGVTDVVCAIGISLEGIEFDAIDGKPCHLIFLIVAPPAESTPYLKALSSVALIGRDPGLVERLRSAGLPEEVLGVLAEVS